METSTFIVRLIIDIMYYEFMWYLVKRGTFKLQMLKVILTYLLYLYGFMFVLGGSVSIFISLYFLTLWYFVIYPDRILNELTEDQAKSITKT